jgi:hypothetical protein
MNPVRPSPAHQAAEIQSRPSPAPPPAPSSDADWDDLTLSAFGPLHWNFGCG